ncbi:MAG: AzlC family ABC transporter permease [Rhodovibrionaceae bacterium]
MPADPDPAADPAARTPSRSYGSPSQAARAAVADAFGVPAFVLGATYLGFGALVREADLNVWLGLFSTATGWALPGQIALVELYSVGAGVLAIAIAVGLTNARLLPMAVTLVPILRSEGTPRWRYYLFAHFIAVTGWAAALRVCPHIPRPERLPYFAAFAATLWATTLCATAAGFFLAGIVPAYVTLGLIFLNPIYFMLVFAADVRKPPRVAALVLGALLGPLIHLASPDWSLMLTGLIGGSLAFLGWKLWGGRHAR